MDSLEARIQRLLPMEGMELAFKYIYENGLELSQVDLHSPDITRFFTQDSTGYPGSTGFLGFSGIASHMREDVSLPNDRFFLPNQNIATARHPRYMPGILHNHHDFFEIQCVLSGEVSQVIGDIPVRLRPGDLCFIAPNSIHGPFVADDETVMINILARVGTLRSAFSHSLSDEDILSDFFMRILYGKTYQPMLICRTGLDPRSFGLVLDMIEAAGCDDPYTDKLLSTMLELLFIYLLRDHKDDFTIGKTLRKTDDNVLTIMRYAQRNYAQVSLSSLARHFNYSESYLSYLIKRYYGRSFQEMMTELRLQNAAQLLSSSQATVSDIVAVIGYTERSHFYRAFKKKYGMTPQEYRSRKAGD